MTKSACLLQFRFLALLLLFAGFSCGNSDFASDSTTTKKRNSADAPAIGDKQKNATREGNTTQAETVNTAASGGKKDDEPQTTPLTDLYITWNAISSCDQITAETDAIPAMSLAGGAERKPDISISDSETAEYPGDLTKDLSLSVTGRNCVPPDARRTLVFVNDISGSTGPNHEPHSDVPYIDANTNKSTCGRYQAIVAVLRESLGKPISFGIVNFEKEATVAYAMQDLTPESLEQIDPEVICQALGSTQYLKALNLAYSMFDSQTRISQKEIFMVSDGEPTDKIDDITAAIDEYKTKTHTDVFLATVMLKGENDNVLKDIIASKDAAGNPVHARVENAKDLASTLSALVDDNIVGGNLSVSSFETAESTGILLGSFEIPTADINAESFAMDVASIQKIINESTQASGNTQVISKIELQLTIRFKLRSPYIIKTSIQNSSLSSN